MGFSQGLIPVREFKRQWLERKKHTEEDLNGNITDDIMPLTDGNDTNPPTYETVKDNGHNDN